MCIDICPLTDHSDPLPEAFFSMATDSSSATPRSLNVLDYVKSRVSEIIDLLEVPLPRTDFHPR